MKKTKTNDERNIALYVLVLRTIRIIYL